MKSLLKNILAHLGIVAFKRSTRIYLPADECYRVVANMCGKKSPLIFDGGAHRGDSVLGFSKYVPAASFYCFEPDPVLVAEMKQIFAGRGNVHIVSAALGDMPSTAQFNINASRPTNSLLPTVPDVTPKFRDLYETLEQVSVDVITVDDYCVEHGIDKVDILKLDLQGYDYKALLGARKTLRKVDVVLTEVWFTETYAGAKLFPDLLALMIESGFRLHALCGMHYGERDELLWGDAIFTRVASRPEPAV